MIRQIARSIADSLRAEPFALALVVVNVLFLMWGGYTMREVSKAAERRDQILLQLAEHCPEQRRAP